MSWRKRKSWESRSGACSSARFPARKLRLCGLRISRSFRAVAEDGAVYMLDPDQHERFAQVRWTAKAAGQAAVGFFRSHSRPGPLKPSLSRPELANRAVQSGNLCGSADPGARTSNSGFFHCGKRSIAGRAFGKGASVLTKKRSKLCPRFETAATVEKPPSRPRAIAKYALAGILLLMLLVAGAFFWLVSRGTARTPMIPRRIQSA